MHARRFRSATAALALAVAAWGATGQAASVAELLKQHQYGQIEALYAQRPPGSDAPSIEQVRMMQEVFDAAKARVESQVGKRLALAGQGLPRRYYAIDEFDGETLSLRSGAGPAQAALRALDVKILQSLAEKEKGKSAEWCLRYGWFMLWHGDPSAARRWAMFAKMKGQKADALEQAAKERKTPKPKVAKKDEDAKNDQQREGETKAGPKLSSAEKKYFVVPSEPKKRAAFLKRWERKLSVKVACDSRDDKGETETERHVVAQLAVKNKSKWTMDFSGAEGPAKALGQLRPGRAAVATVIDVVTATLRKEGDTTYYSYKRTKPRAEIPFAVSTKAGRKLNLRLMVEIDIEADGSRSAWVGMPKQGGTKVRLELGPVDAASLLADAAPTSGGKGAAAKWADVNTKLGTNLVKHESDHFVVYTDFADGKGMARGCEVVYAGLCRVFGVKRKAKLWPDGLVIFFFRNREDFIRFALTYDHFEGAKVSSGYFHPDKTSPHIAIPQPRLAGGSSEYMVSVVVHELGHAFLEAHCGQAPPWLHEGVAQLCEQINDPNDRGLASHRRRVREWVDAALYQPRLARLVAKKSIAGSDTDSYAMSYSVVEWMVKTQPKRFRKLLELTKKGAPAKAALERALGMDLQRVEGQWRRYVKVQY